MNTLYYWWKTDTDLIEKRNERSSQTVYKECPFYIRREMLPTAGWCCHGLAFGSCNYRNLHGWAFENTIVPELTNSLFLSLWKRYVDDTLCLVKRGCREQLLYVLNAYHDNIKFTYEEKRNNMIILGCPINSKCRIHRSCCFSKRKKHRSVH